MCKHNQLKDNDLHQSSPLQKNRAIYTVAERLGYVSISPRLSSPLGLFHKYDGNVLGGALLGAGMALAGSCPGTMYAQLAAGVPTGFYALDGAVVGGILWSGVVSKAVTRRRQNNAVRPEPGVVNEQLGLSRAATVLLLETACVGVVAATAVYTPARSAANVSGAVGGLLIGAAQLVSMVTRRSMVGISGSYEEAGNLFWWLVRGADPDAKPASCSNILFASAVAAGAWSLLKWLPELAAAPVREASPWLAIAGGVLMALGSRMAGGCTSGHGISGISLLSASSVVTIATAFAVGAIVAPLAH